MKPQFNLMSYHHAGSEITADQWVRVTEATDGSRNHVAGIRHWFVDLNNGCDTPNGSRGCAMDGIPLFGLPMPMPHYGGGPFPTVGEAIDAAESGDLLRIGAGS
jgi:hypothetical protein